LPARVARLRIALTALVDRHRNGARAPNDGEKDDPALRTQPDRPIGKVREVGQNLMISVASDASYKKDGEWVNRANWIEHTVFGRRDKMKDWALDTLQSGDLVFIRSTPSQTSWEKDGEKQYGYTMAVTELKLLTAKADLKQRGVH
jgi:single-stranded DNA-binding protein